MACSPQYSQHPIPGQNGIKLVLWGKQRNFVKHIKTALNKFLACFVTLPGPKVMREIFFQLLTQAHTSSFLSKKAGPYEDENRSFSCALITNLEDISTQEKISQTTPSGLTWCDPAFPPSPPISCRVSQPQIAGLIIALLCLPLLPLPCL